MADAPTPMEPDWTPERRARLETCAEHLLCNALNLEADTLPGEMNEDLYRRVAADQKQWTEDLRAALAEITHLQAEVKRKDAALERLKMAGEGPACLTALATNEPCQPDETMKRCTICGFIVDTKYAAHFRAAARGEGSKG